MQFLCNNRNWNSRRTIAPVRWLIAAGLVLLFSLPRAAAVDQSAHRNAGIAVLQESSDPQVAADIASPVGSGTTQPNSQASIGSWPLTLLAVYCLLIVLASLGGGWLPMLMSLTHNRMQLMLSLVGGLMLGIGMFHMLPHAVHEMHSLDRAVWWMMAGMLTMFFLIRMFHFHQHEPPELADVATASVATHAHDHDHDCGRHGHGHHQAHRLGWVGIAFGLSLHTLIDGIALGASVAAATRHAAEWQLLGLGTFLAVALHKPLDAVSITSLMLSGGWSSKARHAVNAGFALMCPLGAFLFVLGIERFGESQSVVVGCALAFSAGVFLCISLGDLLPEMEFHTHNRLPLSIALIAGIALAWGIRYLEPGHLHSHKEAEGISSAEEELHLSRPIQSRIRQSDPLSGQSLDLLCGLRIIPLAYSP